MSTSTNKICLVTGVSRGIGLATAHALLEKGFFVYGFSRNSSSYVSELSSSYSRFNHYCLDIADLPTFNSYLREIWSIHKSINLLVNCAGIAHGGLLSLSKPEDFYKVFSVNYFSPLFLAQSASRYLSKSDSPQIIFISSSSSFRYDPGTLAYASSKAALNYATKQLAFEFAQFGIRVNCIAPGVTNTPMLMEMSPVAIENQLNSSAISSICEPSQIASLILYLYNASHINGQIIRIDGGLP